MRVSRSFWRSADREGAPLVSAEGVYACHFDPTFPIDVGFDIHDSRHHLRMNRHDSFEVIYVYDGQGFFQVQERRFPVRKGNLVVVGPNLYHQVVCRPGSKLRLPFLHFQSGILIGSASGEEEQYLAPFFCQDANFPNVVSRSTGVPDKALELMVKIHRELPPSSEVARLAVKTYLKMLLLLLLRHYHEHVGTQRALERRQREVKRLDALFEFLDQNYGQTIRTVTAARLCAMSKVRFMRFFKKVTGQTFHTYLKHFRISMAQALLAMGEKPISEISALLGFCSQSHFGTTFTAFVGMSPQVYRRRFGRNGESNNDGSVLSTLPGSL
jgi:AraC-like DNA-binding protein